MRVSRVTLFLFLAGVVLVSLSALPAAGAQGSDVKVPVTTVSQEARQAYLKGRDLLAKLRATDARAYFAKAAELDPAFALAELGLANTAPAGPEFFAALRRAGALAEKTSEGEAHMIRALEAGVNGQPEVVRQHLTALVRAYPQDERAHNLLGTFYFGRQEWQAAIEEYRKATAINPEFSQPYNQLGYALRFLEKYDDAEKAFKTYVRLIPDEPNPYDSYAELLMKVGRFAESIAQYEKALKIDPNFVASYVGIANDKIFLGKPQEARKVLAKLDAIARNDGERRLACTWAAVSYLHEGHTKSALGEVERRYQIAKKGNDGVAMAADLNLMGNILLEAGQADAALAKFKEGIIAIDAADATADVKAATHRNHLYDLARVALLRKDVPSAAETAQQYRTQVEARKIPFELWRTHELIGLVAFAKGDFERAVVELEQANQQDPRVVFALGEAYAAGGKADLAKAAFARAAGFNGLGINYAFVRAKAQAKLKA